MATPAKTETRSHEHVLDIKASPEAVWEAITSEKGLKSWFPPDAEVKQGAGGYILYDWASDVQGRCSIEVWEPPRHLRTGWCEGPEGAAAERPHLLVDWFIEGKQGRTVLRLVHSGFGPEANWDEEFEGTRRGWNYELQCLKHYLEKHPEGERRVFWVRQASSLEADVVWNRMTTPGTVIREGQVDGLAVGDPYRIVLASGDVIEGVVWVNKPPHEFAGSATNLNEGVVRFGFENCGPGPEANIWLNTWGASDADMKAIEERWRGLLQRAFG